MTGLAARLLRRLRWAARRPWSHLARRRATRRLRARLAMLAASPPTPSPAGADLDVVVSHRITNADRLAMLQVVVAQVGSSLAGSGTRILVDDASGGDWADAVTATWADQPLEVVLTRSGASQPVSLLGLLEGSDRTFAYLQFDDMLTMGLGPDLLDAACALLATGLVPVVCPMWPLDVQVDEERQVVRLVGHELRRGRYRFWSGRPRRPVAVVTIGEVTFGIFENFTYGFFLNLLVTRRADLAARLAWYVSHVSDRSAHEIELAAAGGRGPGWHHLAVPLREVAILDIDYAHTESAVRNQHPGNRRLLEAMEAGWVVEVVGREG